MPILFQDKTSKPTRRRKPPAERLADAMRDEQLPEPVTEHRFAKPVRQFRFDFAWPDRRLAVEVDGGTWTGGRHTRGAGFESDCEKTNLAQLLGWRVLRFTTSMIRDGRAIATIREALEAEPPTPTTEIRLSRAGDRVDARTLKAVETLLERAAKQREGGA